MATMLQYLRGEVPIKNRQNHTARKQLLEVQGLLED